LNRTRFGISRTAVRRPVSICRTPSSGVSGRRRQVECFVDLSCTC
jgi:hypothetical protein